MMRIPMLTSLHWIVLWGEVSIGIIIILVVGSRSEEGEGSNNLLEGCPELFEAGSSRRQVKELHQPLGDLLALGNGPSGLGIKPHIIELLDNGVLNKMVSGGTGREAR